MAAKQLTFRFKAQSLSDMHDVKVTAIVNGSLVFDESIADTVPNSESETLQQLDLVAVTHEAQTRVFDIDVPVEINDPNVVVPKDRSISLPVKISVSGGNVLVLPFLENFKLHHIDDAATVMRQEAGRADVWHECCWTGSVKINDEPAPQRLTLDSPVACDVLIENGESWELNILVQPFNNQFTA